MNSHNHFNATKSYPVVLSETVAPDIIASQITVPAKRQFTLSTLALALCVLGSAALFTAQPSWAGDDHGSATQTEQADEHGALALKLTQVQQALAGISLLPLSSDSLNIANLNLDIRATATLVVDRDRTATLAPQLDVRV